MRYFQLDGHPIELILSENLDKEYCTHNHANHWVLSMVLSGSVFIHIREEKRHCCSGDYYILPPYTPHALSLNKHARILSVCVEKEYFNKCNFGQLEREVCRYVGELSHRYDIPEEYAKHFNDLTGELYRRQAAYDNEVSEEMKEIALMMAAHPEEEYPLDEISKMVHLNKYQVIKDFKRSVGLSPHQFLLQNRVRKAQRLLSTQETVLDTSIKMGFYDQSHFDKTFQKIVGLSPTEYLNAKELLG